MGLSEIKKANIQQRKAISNVNTQSKEWGKLCQLCISEMLIPGLSNKVQISNIKYKDCSNCH